ncbi:DUF6776 family protein [Rubrivivax sp. RP6-9]|uniref:DUF6776 family protein n=1 Tax=Rubrivivax sp. RP6-9 TaxID=3415750 RepID=UPI003CC65AE7
MRWKLLRRRLSVSAPRMIIRSHLPWPLRWAVAAVVLGFSAAAALWAFEFGKDIAGIDRDAEAELVQLRAEVAALRRDSERAVSVANTAESLLKAERAAQERLAQQLRQLEADKQGLQADLGFFEKLLPAGGEGLQLRGLQTERQGPGELRYQLLVMQTGKAPAEFNGRYDLLLTGLLDGKAWSMSLQGGARPLLLRQYARVEGLVSHPVGAVIKTVQARVIDAQGAVRASQTLRF